MIPTSITGVRIPLFASFKQFFELPNVLDDVLSYQSQLLLNPKNSCNFIQGSLWKQKIESDGVKICIPYFLYNDAFEVNDPLTV